MNLFLALVGSLIVMLVKCILKTVHAPSRVPSNAKLSDRKTDAEKP
jgi:hypothetical protein